MKKFKKILIITIVLIFIVILSFFVWVRIHSTESERKKETEKIIKDVFHLDMKKWDFDYEWENTLSRYKYEGKILVTFIVSQEEADEVLFYFRDRWMEKYETYDLKRVSDRIGIAYEKVEKGKTAIAGHSVVRTLPLFGKYVGKPRSRHHFVYVEQLDDEKVKVYLSYYEN